MAFQTKKEKSAGRVLLEDAIGIKTVVPRPYGVGSNDRWDAERQADVIISNIRLSVLRGSFKQSAECMVETGITLDEAFNRKAKIQLPWYELKTELAKPLNHKILEVAVKAAAEEAGVNPQEVSIAKRDRALSFFGPKVYVIVPSEDFANNFLRGVTPPQLS